MESIRDTLNDMSQMFYKKMTQFEKSLQENSTVTQAKEPTRIQEEFLDFKKFVIFALNALQKQMDFLSVQYDKTEMRTRSKMLLVHGVPEEEKEDTPNIIAKFLNDNIEGRVVSPASFTKCSRLGRFRKDKPRAILIKFKDIELRSNIWFSKTSLKGTGVNMSEFLTKDRYKTFLEARQRFGMTKCWTKDGFIYILAPDGSRHRAVYEYIASYIADLDGIVSPTVTDNIQGPSGSVLPPAIRTRSKKQIVKK